MQRAAKPLELATTLSLLNSYENEGVFIEHFGLMKNTTTNKQVRHSLRIVWLGGLVARWLAWLENVMRDE